MTQSEVGAYILLLCHQWQSGKISRDADRLKIVAKGDVSAHVLSKFQSGRNKRLEIERKKQAIYREKQRENGIASGKARRERSLNVGSTNPSTKHPTKTNSPSPSPSPIAERESFAEIPPISRKEFDQIAEVRGVPKDCADWFWNTHDARNWIDTAGHPIRKVEPLLLNALKSWRAKSTTKASPSDKKASLATEPVGGRY